MLGQAPMVHLLSKGLAFLWNAIATSAHPTQVPAWTRSTGRTQMLSIHQGILASQPAPRSMKLNASRSVLRDARLRLQISRSRMDGRRKSRIVVLGRFLALSTGRAWRFATMPVLHHSASDTDGVPANS